MVAPFIDCHSAKRIGIDWIMGQLRPLSPYGEKRLKKVKPYLPGQERQLTHQWRLLAQVVERWQKNPASLQALEHALYSLRDVTGLVAKASRGHVLEDIELFEIKQWLEQALRIKSLLKEQMWPPARCSQLPVPVQLLRILEQGEQGAGFYLGDGLSADLARLRSRQRQKKAELAKGKRALQQKISLETGLKFNHQGRLRVSKLRAEELKRLKGREDLLLAAETFTDVEFVLRETPAMLALAGEIAHLEDQIEAEELKVRQWLSTQVAAWRQILLACCNRLGCLDLLLAQARLARQIGGCVPKLITENRIFLAKFTNPAVAQRLAKQGLDFQPLTVAIGSSPVTVVTGANMGGKSVALKSVGLAVAMAQLGLLVPAEHMEFSLRQFVYYSQQSEEPEQGLSTFGAEISSLAQALPKSGKRGLYLLDEPARGTNPREGQALVKAMVVWLTRGKSLSFVATHFSGLADIPGVAHLQVAGLARVKKGDLEKMFSKGIKSLQQLMDYSLIQGRGEVPRDALKVAAFLGLDSDIINMALNELGLLPQEVGE